VHAGGLSPREPFLTATWRHLVLLSYEVDPAVLALLVPAGTELDLWEGRALVSVVGFRFFDTRVLGWRIPGHRNFDEVNLRFYVRRQADGPVRHGVVFVRELVPRAAVAWLARRVYNEPYRAVTMRSAAPGRERETSGRLVYEWRSEAGWQRVAATPDGPAVPPPAGSEAAFITQHSWGYTRQLDGSTIEYEVEHPPWRVWSAAAPALEADVAGLYGAAFVAALSRPPTSALVADGSPVVVHRPRRIAGGASAPGPAAGLTPGPSSSPAREGSGT
jgi:uncharacterized protein YqjF (DUF2071 family)